MMLEPLTAADFHRLTGHSPENDDLTRVNCDKAGEIGHWGCGICYDHQKPVFECPVCFSKSPHIRRLYPETV